MSLLEITGLTYSIDGFMAVAGVDLSVSAGELMAVIGPNGAGKTTLFNLVSGFLSPSSGEILFKGERIAGLPPYRIVQKGICRAFQLVNIFHSMTVLENVRMGVLADRGLTASPFRDVEGMRGVNEEAERILMAMGLEGRRDQVAGSIPHGFQKSLEIGIALSRRADLLLLDEPTSGMNPEETQAFMRLMEDVLRGGRMSMIIVEHDMDLVFNLARRIVVMCEGRIVADGEPARVREDDLVRRIYLGA
jgi:branched-chain amino acid transport system ATP-binding protein